MGQEVADKIGAFTFLECSAKEKIGVPEVFQAAARAALSTKGKGRKSTGSVFKSLKSSLSSISLGGGGKAEPTAEQAKLKDEALAVKGKLKRLKEEAVAEKARLKKIHDEEKAEKARIKSEAAAAAQAESARLKSIAAADKQAKVAWKQRYAAASPEGKLEMKAEAKTDVFASPRAPPANDCTSRQLYVGMLQRQAEAAAKKELAARADAAAVAAAAAAARNAVLAEANLPPAQPSPGSIQRRPLPTPPSLLAKSPASQQQTTRKTIRKTKTTPPAPEHRRCHVTVRKNRRALPETPPPSSSSAASGKFLIGHDYSTRAVALLPTGMHEQTLQRKWSLRVWTPLGIGWTTRKGVDGLVITSVNPDVGSVHGTGTRPA